VLTSEDQQAIVHLFGRIADRENVILDFSDERQYRAAIAFHNLAGHTSETRPGMHAALAERRDRHVAQNGIGAEDLPGDGTFQTGAQVNDISRVPGTQNAGSTGFAGVVGGAFQLNAAIAVLNAQNTTVLASGSGTRFNQGDYVGLFATPIGGQSAQSQMNGSVVYSYQAQPGGPWVTGATKRSVSLGVLQDPTVVHPNKHQTRYPSTFIRIALGRGNNLQDDVDYWYWYQQSSTSYAIPWYGSVTFTAAPQALAYGTNPVIYGTLARGPGGAGGYATLPATQVQNLFNNLHVSGNTLSWTLAPAATQPPWGQMGNPLVWGPLNWSNGEADYVTIQLMVYLTGQSVPAVVTVQSATTTIDQDALDGTTNIPPLQFVWSCLVTGTPILRPDGSTIPIEEVVRGTVVRCGDGVDREVSSTTVFRYAGEVLRLRTADGSEVALSGNHPVMTADGARQAQELELGAELQLAGGGTSALERAEREPYEGLLCNLRLDESSDPDPARSSVYAGGIEVGDYALQIAYDRNWRTDPDRIRSLLEPRYHEDYANFLQETAAKR
jgi:hypothetical protein